MKQSFSISTTLQFSFTPKKRQVLSFALHVAKGNFDESGSVEFRWSGATEFQQIKMKPGWKDSRVVSKRCISLSRGRFKETIHRFNFLNHFFISCPIWRDFCPWRRREIFTQWSSNCSDNRKILMKPLQIDELKKLLLFLRDAFEIILQDRILSMNPYQTCNSKNFHWRFRRKNREKWITFSLIAAIYSVFTGPIKTMESITLERSIHVLQAKEL